MPFQTPVEQEKSLGSEGICCMYLSAEVRTAQRVLDVCCSKRKGRNRAYKPQKGLLWSVGQGTAFAGSIAGAHLLLRRLSRACFVIGEMLKDKAHEWSRGATRSLWRGKPLERMKAQEGIGRRSVSNISSAIRIHRWRKALESTIGLPRAIFSSR